MKTRWRSLVVAGAILGVLSSQALAQPGGDGAGRGRGFRRGQATGMTAERPGPARQGIGSGGRGVCPFGLEPGLGRVLGGSGIGLGFGRLLGGLELTDEQKTAIRGILAEAEPQVLAAQGAVAAANTAVQDAVIGAAADKEIRAAASILGAAIGDRAVIHARTTAAVKAVLTDKQRQQMEKMQETLAQSREGTPGRRMGRGPGGGRPARDQ